MMTTDDDISISILKSIAQTHLGPAAGELPPNPELRSALATAFGSPVSPAASEGELARSALYLLRQDPAFAEMIHLAALQVAAPKSRERYFEPLTIGLITAALLALQTRVKFKLDSNHKWSIEVDKKSSSDTVVKLSGSAPIAVSRKIRPCSCIRPSFRRNTPAMTDVVVMGCLPTLGVRGKSPFSSGDAGE
jgi:hypothetical protein